jgi:site-specific recombinase XerD
MTTPALWLTNPIQAHSEWRKGLMLSLEKERSFEDPLEESPVKTRPYAKQSQRVYNSLFGKFCTWMSANQYNLLTLTAADLTKFLDTLEGRGGGEVADRTKRTYVAEIDRVLSHLQAQELRSDNPVKQLMDTLRVTTPLKPRAIHLPDATTRENYIKSLAQNSAVPAPEQLQRAAMNLLMLDCGFTLKELQKLDLDHVAEIEQGKVIAPGHRVLQERVLKMSSESLHWLKQWLEARKNLDVISRTEYKARQAASLGLTRPSTQKTRNARRNVFVSFTGKAGKDQALRGSGLVVDRLPDSTIYLSAQEVMAAGLGAKGLATAKNKGPQALRNLCCATMVNDGVPAQEVAHFLGLGKADQVWAMARHIKSEKK